MILTDKSKEDFLKYLQDLDTAPYPVMFSEVPLTIQLTYIVDWFDSVNINIHTDITEAYYVGKIYNTSLKEPDYNDVYYHNISRHEVIRDLIEKSNEIYNKNNT